MSSLIKRNKVWYIKFSKTIAGNRSRVTKSLNTTNKVIAEKKQKELDQLVNSGELNPFSIDFEIPEEKQSWYTVQECIDDFLDERSHLANITLYYFKSFLNRWATVMEISNTPIHIVKVEHVKPFILRDGKERSPKTAELSKIKPSTMRSHFRRFKTFWNWLLAEGRIEQNICKDIKLPESNVQYVPKMITESEFKRMVKTFTEHQNKRRNEPWFRDFMEQHWFIPVMKLFFETGLRLSEVGRNNKVPHSGLQGFNLLWQGDTVEYIYLSKNKTNRERLVPITNELSSELNSYFKIRGIPTQKDYVFLNGKNQPVTARNMYDQFKYYCKKAGISDDRTIHGMRHRRITTWLEEGLSMKEASVMAGHKSTETTDKVYSHLAAGRLRKKILDIEKRNSK